MTKPAVLYRFTPHSDGAFIQHVPQRDLTQADVDNMTGMERRDAFSPHPVLGVPMYTAVKGADVPDFSRVHEVATEEPEPVEIVKESPKQEKKDGAK